MTVKDQLHQLIDDLDEAAAIEALDYLRLITNGHPTPESETRSYFPNVIDEDDDAEAIIARLKPITADDPLWNIVGMACSEEPTNIAKYKDQYLAEAYEDIHRK